MSARLLPGEKGGRDVLELGPRVRLPVLADVRDPVSPSELERFDACEFRWRYEYALRLRQKREPIYFKIGKVIHAALEAGYLSSVETRGAEIRERNDLAALAGENAITAKLEKYERRAEDEINNPDLRDRLLREADEVAKLARFLVPRYWRHYADDLERFEVAEVERRATAPLGPRTSLLYVRDLVLFERETRTLVVVDTKTSGQALELLESRVALDAQMTGYTWALAHELRTDFAGYIGRSLLPDELRDRLLEQGRVHVGQVMFNAVKTWRPKAPRILKDGTVSAAAQDTTPELYAAALEAAGRPAELREAEASGDAKKLAKALTKWEKTRREQLERLEQLRERPGVEVFRRIEFHRTARELEDWREETETLALRVQARRQRPEKAVRSRWVCSGPRALPCPFRLACLDPDVPDFLDGFRTSDPYERLRGDRDDGDETNEGEG